jgi:hypothetical protein
MQEGTTMDEERAQILEMLVAGRNRQSNYCKPLKFHPRLRTIGQLEQHRRGAHNGEEAVAQKISSPA